MDYVIVTSIFDIKKFYPGLNRWRSPERYMKMFKWIYDLNVNTYIFIDPHLIPRFNDVIKTPRDNLIIIPYKLEDLPLYQKIKDIDGLHPVSNGQHVNKHFTSVINSKFYLVDLVRRKYLLNSGVSHMIWLDSGVAHVGTISMEQFYEDIKLHLHPSSITVTLMKAIHPNEILDLKSHLQTSFGKIAAGIAVIPTNMVEWYGNQMDEIFDFAIKESKVMCYEEQLMAVILAKFPDKFKFIYGDYSAILKNMRHITAEITTVINNLIYCREYSLNCTGYDIIIKVISSVGKARSKILYRDFHELCYNGQITCYYVDKDLSRYFAYMIGFLYYNTTQGNEYFKPRYENIKTNISFLGIDLDDPEKFTEAYINDIDIYDILWSIL